MKEVHDQVAGQVFDEVRYQVYNQVEKQVRNKFLDRGYFVEWPVKDQVEYQVMIQAGYLVGYQVWTHGGYLVGYYKDQEELL